MVYPFPHIETTPLLTTLIEKHSPVAVGVSGGKDSDVTAFEVKAYLNVVGHKGPLILVHSDLGRVEHPDSLPACERLATRLGLDLIVVRRQAGDLMDRWLTRWQRNVERYSQLLCVKVILPWSTASMRFCTSELKTAIICRDLVERYPKAVILNAAGIRRQESSARAKAPICAPQVRLTSTTFETTGYNWLPILSWSLEDVLAHHRIHNFPLHEAYATYGMSRVSCAYCILAGLDDLKASAMNPANHEIYREMVDLEIASSFSFQSDRWLGDIAPQLLSKTQLTGLAKARQCAAQREQLESRIPRHLLYTKGWPTMIPNRQEAHLLSDVRNAVADLMQITIQYRDPEAIIARYQELLELNQGKKRYQQDTHMSVPHQHHLWDIEHSL
ncbi:phosphoadenosine phosphosulfate reductase domain-containing protein [Tengunoibacter tsumagoiensis]|uniref:Phosphoadenosine phosphosulphate reductase domain-containing protein n=1 Tax=Tengunoibacter tsumagoiensis TaxID=2014871 RepID=A0A402A828_9CHLR|nr:phosphoadenosine phosphosulfate reductase family protein [Tengunoibacter tsumagoiensis]GCE15302.1 hypothetical protein KTT_51610 [Tengunoibacter tsumagoiensis]